MTKNYGIKVSRQGFDVKTATPQQLAFSSKYRTFKIHARGSGTVNSSSGGGLITIPHGLGYPPAFLVHIDENQVGDYCISPSPYVYAYSDSTNLYIKADTAVSTNTYTLDADGDTSMGREIVSTGTFTNGWGVGQTSTPNTYYGAVRFTGISLANGATVTSATLNLYIATREGTGEVKLTAWGVDEDNIGPFNGSGANPTSRAKTTASTNSNSTLVQGNGLGFSVKAQVEEIVARAGWSSGNSIAIMFWDNGTSAGNLYAQLFGDTSNTNLEIVRSTPTIANYKYTIFLNQLE